MFGAQPNDLLYTFVVLILEGCLNFMAENIPLLPDADNAAEGTDSLMLPATQGFFLLLNQFFVCYCPASSVAY